MMIAYLQILKVLGKCNRKMDTKLTPQQQQKVYVDEITQKVHSSQITYYVSCYLNVT